MTTYIPQSQYNDYLYHYGVMGMRWGHRKEPQNPNYSDKQRKSDASMYGKRAVKRINRRMNKGEGILAARHHEVKRKHARKAIIGGLAAATTFAASAYYMRNKDHVDSFVSNAVSKGINKANEARLRGKGKELFIRLGLS